MEKKREKETKVKETKKKIEKTMTKTVTKKVKVSHNEEGEVNLENPDHLVDELAVRWWYALPQYPPAGCDYNTKLKEHGFRLVDASRWKFEPEEDA